MANVINLGSLGKKPQDKKMSKDEILQKCLEDIQFIMFQVFGSREDGGKKFDKYYKCSKCGLNREAGDKICESCKGEVVAIAATGLLQKFEGAYEFDDAKNEWILIQKGLEQYWHELSQRFQELDAMQRMIAMQNKIDLARVAVLLKVTPGEMIGMLENRETEVQGWLDTYTEQMEIKFKTEQELNKKQDEDNQGIPAEHSGDKETV